MADYPLESEGWFVINNAVFDIIMPRLSANAFKILCVAIRQTEGWEDLTTPSKRKERDWIVYSQFMQMTGIKSKHTITTAIEECITEGVLIRETALNKTTRGGKPVYYYRLNKKYQPDRRENRTNDTNSDRRENRAITPPDRRENRAITKSDRRENRAITPPDRRENRAYKKKDSKQRDGEKQQQTKETAKSEVQSVVVVDNSSQIKLFSEFGIALNDTTRALLERPVTDIQAWINFARSQGNLNNPAGAVIRGLQSGEQPPNGGEHETSRTRNHNATVNDKAIEISDRRRQRTIVL